MMARSWCDVSIYGAAGGMFGYARPGEGLIVSADNPLLTQRHIALDAHTVAVLHANRCTFVHDIDDLLWSIPIDNPGAAELGPDILAKMDVSLRLADLVTTSTLPLADALKQRGIDAVVIPNLLDPSDWQVTARRNERTRLRVGWYGQRNLHVEDLNVIYQVITALEHEVDFVFYGDIPIGLQPRRAAFEVYPVTGIDLFPTMLAMLDLDILLSPLAKNAFNECKSNLRLLQAGMLGYAVIATDIEPHRTLPVTLVENTSDAWIRAIRERIGEQDAVRAEGQCLQAEVTAQYMLDDRWAERIFTTWTGRSPPRRSNRQPNVAK